MSAVQQPTPPSRHRFHLLDGMRGIAAATLITWHAPDAIRGQPYMHGAFLAVDFFFCLSGFVIAYSYEQRLAQGLRFRDFAALRAIRLYPVYLLGTVAGFLTLLYVYGFPMSHGREAKLLLTSVLFLPAYRWVDWGWLFPLDFPAWSLFFEVLANAVFAIVAIRHRISTRTLLLVAVGAFITMASTFANYGTINTGWSHTRTDFLMGTVRILLSFVPGMLVFRLIRAGGLERVRGWLLPTASVVSLCFILFLPLQRMQSEVFELFSAAVLFPMIVYSAARCNPPAAWTRICVILGEISYPLYLLHVPLLAQLRRPFFAAYALEGSLHRAALLGAVILIALAMSYAVAKLYDEPLRRWLARRYFAKFPIKPQHPVRSFKAASDTAHV